MNTRLKKITVRRGPVLLGCIVVILLLSGCATTDSINRNAATINYSDGINEQEAKYIAQKYCLDKGIRDIFISSPEVEETFSQPKVWEIRFQEKNLSQFDYRYTLFIDKKTGEVTYSGYEK